MLHEIHKVLSHIKRKLLLMFRMPRAKKVKISMPAEVGEKILEIKPKTVEPMPLVRTMNLINDGEIRLCMPEIDIYKYENACVFSKSDFIICGEKAVWQKFHTPQFTKIVPLDKDLLTRREDCLFVRRPKAEIAVDIGFSLCGVHCHVWSHFIVQYLPKLYMLPMLQSEEKRDVTIIVPNYSDPQICEIIDLYLANKSGIKLLKLDDSKVALCKELYNISSTSFLSDHADYISPADVLIPTLVGDFFKENLVSNYSSKKTTVDNPIKKLYIDRSGGIRNLLNSREIKNFFIGKGFEIVEPHKMHLNDKIQLFKEAGLVVGPYSSGFSNLIFSLPGTKALAFLNFQRVFEGYHSFLKRDFGIDYNIITGSDLHPNDIHSDYTIELDDIKKFCEIMGI